MDLHTTPVRIAVGGSLFALTSPLLVGLPVWVWAVRAVFARPEIQ